MFRSTMFAPPSSTSRNSAGEALFHAAVAADRVRHGRPDRRRGQLVDLLNDGVRDLAQGPVELVAHVHRTLQLLIGQLHRLTPLADLRQRGGAVGGGVTRVLGARRDTLDGPRVDDRLGRLVGDRAARRAQPLGEDPVGDEPQFGDGAQPPLQVGGVLQESVDGEQITGKGRGQRVGMRPAFGVTFQIARQPGTRKGPTRSAWGLRRSCWREGGA